MTDFHRGNLVIVVFETQGNCKESTKKNLKKLCPKSRPKEISWVPHLLAIEAY
jgi:hypothetical protein